MLGVYKGLFTANQKFNWLLIVDVKQKTEDFCTFVAKSTIVLHSGHVGLEVTPFHVF